MNSVTYTIPALQGPLRAQITLPGSKSIALRQLAMAALTEGTSRIFGIPPCDDTEAMLDCLEALHAKVERREDHVLVHGPMNFTREVTLDARMSGASTRLLLGLAALREGRTHIDGHSSLRARTNAPLLDVLAAHGCRITADNGCLPVTVQGPLHPPGELHIDGSLSSQYVTALLLSAPFFSQSSPSAGRGYTGRQKIKIDGTLVSRPYIDITINEMAKRGISAQWLDEHTLEVHAGVYAPGEVHIEGDASAATYFAALATLHRGDIVLANLGNNTCQGDYGFFAVMESLGAVVTRSAESTRIQGPTELRPLPITDMNDMPDAALTLIAMTPLLPEGGTIEGLSSLHHKECDRLECPAREFIGLGVRAVTTPDSISIESIEPLELQPHLLTTYHDHRMAMAFSLLGSVSGTLSVDDKAVVDKTYPAYWSDYESLATAAR